MDPAGTDELTVADSSTPLVPAEIELNVYVVEKIPLSDEVAGDDCGSSAGLLASSERTSVPPKPSKPSRKDAALFSEAATVADENIIAAQSDILESPVSPPSPKPVNAIPLENAVAVASADSGKVNIFSLAKDIVDRLKRPLEARSALSNAELRLKDAKNKIKNAKPVEVVSSNPFIGRKYVLGDLVWTQTWCSGKRFEWLTNPPQLSAVGHKIILHLVSESSGGRTLRFAKQYHDSVEESF
jgi:hypothetical protein